MRILKVLVAAFAAAMVGLASAGGSGGAGAGGGHGGKSGGTNAGASSGGARSASSARGTGGGKSASSTGKADFAGPGSHGSAAPRRSADGMSDNRCIWLMGAERKLEGCLPPFEPATEH